MSKKPGASFAFEPQNSLAAADSPDFTRSPKKRDEKTQAALRQSFYDLVQSTTITLPTSARTPTPAMPHSRTPSFGDDDLLMISSQSQSTSQPVVDMLMTSPLQPSESRDTEPVALPDSPAGKQAPAPAPGRPFARQPSFPQRKGDPFIHQKTRPEHHRDLYRVKGPLAPKQKDKKPSTLQMFGSLDPSAQPATQNSQIASQSSQTGASFADQVFYTDPEKASEDLKALLEGGMDEDDEEVAGQEHVDDGSWEGITVKLLPHQVEGVEWMRGRELGPVKKGKVPKGGILADDMGLGKTLQSIALIISNIMPKGPESPGWKSHFDQVKKATLVVAPLALIRQWEAEIKAKLAKTHALKVCVHHGPQRTKSAKELGRYDVVITTYQILVSEHGNSSLDTNGLQAGCFGVHWYRVILDEAHSIKNRNAKATRAACALRSEYRWCLTGTPMQNNLDELQSLVHFLRIQPYDDLAEWRQNIDGPMKNGKGHIALRRLHTLLRCFMKRRTKDVLKEEGALVAGGKKALDAAAAKAAKEGRAVEQPKAAFKITERKVVTVATEFSPAEREFYDRLEERADKSLEKMMKGKISYANALVLLLRLRQACNHPRLTQTNLGTDKDALVADTNPKSSEVDVDDLADAFGGMAIRAKQCEMCMSDLSQQEAEDGYKHCWACTKSLEKLDMDDPQRKKPKKKGRRVSVVNEEVKVRRRKHKPRARRIVTDSDDEGDGSWLVPEDQRGDLKLGKAGGEEDEDAEGVGEDIGSEDSDHPSEAGGNSQADSFVVNDEDAEDEAASGSDDSFLSVSKIQSQVVSSQEPADSLSQDDSDDGSGISASELDSDSDSDSSSDAPSKPRRRRRPKGGMLDKNHVMRSAKIRELISLLSKEASEHKFIIFSQFTSMLDLVEPFLLSQPGLKFARYDGQMRNDAREAALAALRTDPHTRVLLCSLKCGALGLNLTAATRVVIVEPFWNPFVEEQAIDRVHRLTQTVDVVVYRLTVAGTVEERILELQERKRKLAAATIEGGMSRKGKDALKLGLKEILDLFKHDARSYADEGHGEFLDGKVVQADVGAMMALSRKYTNQKKQESQVFGRRW